MHTPEQVCKRRTLTTFVPLVVVDRLAEQSDLKYARVCEALDLIDNMLGLTMNFWTPRIRHDTVSAELVASTGNTYVRLRVIAVCRGESAR